MTTRMEVLEDANQHQQYKNLHDLNSGKISQEEFIRRQEKRSLKYQELLEVLKNDNEQEANILHEKF